MSDFKKALDHFRLPSWQEIKDGFKAWVEENGRYYAISTIVNVGTLLLLAIIGGTVILRHKESPPAITAFNPETEKPPQFFELKNPPNYDPSVLDLSSVDLEDKPVMQEAEYNDDSEIFEKAGGGTAAGVAENMGLGLDLKVAGPGPLLKGGGGVEAGIGEGTSFGSGGNKSGFGGRGSGHRDFIPGVTAQSERAVQAALFWLKQHQNDDGSWSLDHTKKCRDKTCTGGNSTDPNDAAGTAFGLLPFLAAGQTHESKGVYRDVVNKGLQWLVKHQKPDGDLSNGSRHQMYTHSLAAIALCEAYGMSSDSRIKKAAQDSINFIQTAQNNQGGWRITHGVAESDTSVFGWTVMALKSAQMASMDTDPAVMDRANGWLKSVATGNFKGLYPYQRDGAVRESMTGLGLLCSQYLGAQRDDPNIKEGVEYLVAHLPDKGGDGNIYYWYYATQAMHNVPGPDWEKWNRTMRRLLIDSQSKGKDCATGSWAPEKDQWGFQGGRLMVTSLSCLTLEVYYRYLPLYKLDKEGDGMKAPGK